MGVGERRESKWRADRKSGPPAPLGRPLPPYDTARNARTRCVWCTMQRPGIPATLWTYVEARPGVGAGCRRPPSPLGAPVSAADAVGHALNGPPAGQAAGFCTPATLWNSARPGVGLIELSRACFWRRGRPSAGCKRASLSPIPRLPALPASRPRPVPLCRQLSRHPSRTDSLHRGRPFIAHAPGLTTSLTCLTPFIPTLPSLPSSSTPVMPGVVVRQRKPWRRKDGVFIYFEDNAGVIVNPKGEMKGSAITGPVAKGA